MSIYMIMISIHTSTRITHGRTLTASVEGKQKPYHVPAGKQLFQLCCCEKNEANELTQYTRGNKSLIFQNKHR